MPAVNVARSLLAGDVLEFELCNDATGLLPLEESSDENHGADVSRPPVLPDSFTLSSSSVAGSRGANGMGVNRAKTSGPTGRVWRRSELKLRVR